MNVAGIPNRIKWGHLKDLHKALMLVETALVATDPTITSPAPNIEVEISLLSIISRAWL